MPYLARGGASRPPCTTHASGQPLLYKASRLFTAFVLKVQKFGGVFSCPELGPWGGWGRGSYAHNGLLHLPLRSGKSLIIAILWFVFVCHSISIIGELPDISIHIAMFATLYLPTSAYPLLQLGLKQHCVHQEYRV